LENLRHLIALNLTHSIGARRFRSLIDYFGSSEAIMRASASQLQRVAGIGPEIAQHIVEARNDHRPDEQLERAEALGVQIVPFDSPDYPNNLQQTCDPPIVLHVKGEFRRADAVAVAVVGTRAATYYGESMAEKLAGGLASIGFTVVSGMARGIDTAAHRGALKASGRTVAVLGCGVDVCYPPENQGLYEAIAANGAVVSEFPLGAGPMRENFPRRNRLISGLSLGVCVVEAPARSGALITARWALEQGREVFAVPGKASSPSHRGCHRLIKQGAKLVENIDDILEELGEVAAALRRQVPSSDEPEPPSLVKLDGDQKAIYDCLSDEPMNIEDIIAATTLPAQKVSGGLALLKMKSVVKELPGMNFVRK